MSLIGKDPGLVCEIDRYHLDIVGSLQHMTCAGYWRVPLLVTVAFYWLCISAYMGKRLWQTIRQLREGGNSVLPGCIQQELLVDLK